MLGITYQLYKFKWGKLKTRSLIGSSACNLRMRMCDRRLVSWLVNSRIWQRRNSEMSLLFLQCLGSERFFGQFADQKKHLAYCWRVLGPIQECGLILWLKVCGVFSREPRWLPTFYLFSFSHLPFLITCSIMPETTQECTWSNRKRHCTSKYNNIVLWILFLQNIHG